MYLEIEDLGLGNGSDTSLEIILKVMSERVVSTEQIIEVGVSNAKEKVKMETVWIDYQLRFSRRDSRDHHLIHPFYKWEKCCSFVWNKMLTNAYIIFNL